MDDLISEFITESTESIALLDLELVKLEKNPQDAAILGTIFRVMHTIKGTCGFLGLPRLESVAHASENVLGKIRDKELEATPQAVSLILESLDNIKGLIDHLSNHGTEQEGEDSALIARLNRFAETGIVGDAPAAEAEAATAEAPVANGMITAPEHDPFPHFKGEDDPALKAAMDAILAKTPASEVQPVPEEDASKPAPAAEAPSPAGDNAFPHFKGEDDPALKAAMDAILAKTPASEVKPVPESEPQKAAPKPVAKSPAPKPAPAPDKDHAQGDHKEGGGGATQSIRVNIDVLETLMQMVSELVLTRNQLMQIVRAKEDKDFTPPLQQLSHITTELQDSVMKTRMQPISNAWSKFPRLIRDLSIELGKKIDLKMVGAETELDRQLLEVIKDPLTHMVRNSCDHGLETPADRVAAGKPELGTVTLSAYHEGGHIIIEISDDGRGINIEKVKAKALASGIATQAMLDVMSEKQIAQFVFNAGFSTAEKVTSVSGRGVGMDVVKTNIEKIGGAIELDSIWGKGSKISIKIPLTLAIVSVLLVEVGGQKFAIPQINVMELVRVSAGSELTIETINNSPVLRLRNKLLPLAVLSEILGFHASHKAPEKKEYYIAVCKVGEYDFGILVDRIFDTEEIVVKPVPSILKRISVYSGNTILGDGSVIMILDPNGIVKALGSREIATQNQAAQMQKSTEVPELMVGFLLFNLGNNIPKSVPLELVSRLEEVDVTSIEVAGDQPVVQYRGELMRLMMLDNTFTLPATGTIDVIVFSYDKKVVGLVVKEIIDIVHTPFALKMTSNDAKEKGYLGSMIIAGKSTDVVDVNFLLTQISGPEDMTAKEPAKIKAENWNLMLVEDSPFQRNMIVPFLSSAGYKVTAMKSAEEAMETLASGNAKIDMIVTDIEMPGMDGFAFAKACRDMPFLSGLPIVAFTSSLSEEVKKRSHNAGMNDCISKTDRTGLLQSLLHLLTNEPFHTTH